MQFDPEFIAGIVREGWDNYTIPGRAGRVYVQFPIPKTIPVGDIPNLEEAEKVEIRWTPEGDPYLLFVKFVESDGSCGKPVDIPT